MSLLSLHREKLLLRKAWQLSALRLGVSLRPCQGGRLVGLSSEGWRVSFKEDRRDRAAWPEPGVRGPGRRGLQGEGLPEPQGGLPEAAWPSR